MKRFKSAFASLLVVMALVISPSVSFAQNNNNNKDSNHGKSVREVKGTNVKADKNGRPGFFLSRIGDFFGNKRAQASLASSVSSQRSNGGPNISGISSPTVLRVGETGTWNVKASDPKNSTLSYSVDWGDAMTSSPTAKMAPSFVQTAEFTHAYQAPGTYTVVFTVQNSAGLTAMSKVTVRVGTGENVQAPVISNVSAKGERPRHATITWNTDLKASSMLWYGTTSGVNTSGNANISRNGKLMNHKIELNRLSPGTTYYVVVGSANKGGKTLSSEISFTTPAADLSTAPVIKSLSGPSTVAVGTQATVVVSAYDPNNKSLSYAADWGDNASMMRSIFSPKPVFVQTAEFSHVYSTPGTYTATFTVENSAGKKVSSSMNITVTAAPGDTTKPVISNISTKSDASTSVIAWTTDEPTRGVIFYGTVSPLDTQASTTASVSDMSLSTSHSINVSGLASGMKFYFVIEAADASSNKSTSAESTFTTSS